MKRKLSAIGAVLLLGTAAALTAGASQGDPLVTRSYLEQTYAAGLLSQAAQRMQSGGDAAFQRGQTQLKAAADALDQGLSGGYRYAALPAEQRVKAGDVIVCPTGSTFTLLAGRAVLTQGSAADTAAGTALAAGAAAPVNHPLLTTEQGLAQYTVTSDTAVIAPQGYYGLTPSPGFDCNQLADALYAMGLFRGTDLAIGSGYDLEGAPNRIQGLIMSLRLQGEEKAALAFAGTHPFQDVPAWCAPYVAYAYQKGYTKGVDAQNNLFGTNLPLSANHYLTFLLRAQGYRDSGPVPDFSWDQAGDFAQSIQMLNGAEAEKLRGDSFLRSHVVYLSYYALSSPNRAGELLLDKLISAGAVDAANAMLAVNRVTSPRIGA